MNPDPTSWLELAGGEIAFDQYPDGSFQFRITKFTPNVPVQTVALKSTLPASLIACAQVIDALNEIGERVVLSIQTFPDQRGDKHTRQGDSLPVRVTAAMIAAMEPYAIVVHDLHSTEAMQWLSNNGLDGDLVKHVSNLDCFKQCENAPPVVANSYVVAVDKGAVGRASAFADAYGCKLIVMDKKRDADGRIIGHEISSIQGDAIVPGSQVWVVDDLCDGGATFISVSQTIAELGASVSRYHLYVTHGLFSKGRSELLAHYDTVNCLFAYDEWHRPETTEEQKARVGTSDVLASFIGADEAAKVRSA
jgi:phosphoribosylpyrophosphate synthetase